MLSYVELQRRVDSANSSQISPGRPRQIESVCVEEGYRSRLWSCQVSDSTANQSKSPTEAWLIYISSGHLVESSRSIQAGQASATIQAGLASASIQDGLASAPTQAGQASASIQAGQRQTNSNSVQLGEILRTNFSLLASHKCTYEEKENNGG